MRARHNAAKKRALQVFADFDTWMNVRTWARLADVKPVRREYTYLARLALFGLLERARDAQGRLLYQITERGRKRLAWLCSSVR